MRKLRSLSLLIVFALVLTILAPAEVFSATPVELGTKYPSLDSNAWNLVWSDEFNGSSVDTSKWTFTVGGGGFGNNEQ